MASKESLVAQSKAVMALFTELSLHFLEEGSEGSFSLSKDQRIIVESLINAASAHSDELVRARAEDFNKLLAKIDGFTIDQREEVPLYITKGRTYAKDIITKIAPSQSNTPRTDTQTPKNDDDSSGGGSPRPRSNSLTGSMPRRPSISIVTSPRKSVSHLDKAAISTALAETSTPESAEAIAPKYSQEDLEEVKELKEILKVVEESSLTIKERKKLNLPPCFSAPDFLDVIMKKKLVKSRDVALKYAIRMQNHRLIFHVYGPHIFKDDPSSYFRFQAEDGSTSASSHLALDWRTTAAVQKEIADLHKGAKKAVKEEELEHGAFKKKIFSIWTTCDVNANGTLDDNEQELFFGLVYDQIYLSSSAKRKSKLETPPPREETILKWRKHFDANGDGLIQWDEFKASIMLLVDINEAERIRLADVTVSSPEKAGITPAEALKSSDRDTNLGASNIFVKDILKLMQRYSGDEWAKIDETKRSSIRQSIWAKFASYHSASVPKPVDPPSTHERVPSTPVHERLSSSHERHPSSHERKGSHERQSSNSSPATLVPPMLKDAKLGKSQGSGLDLKKAAKDFESLEKVSKKSTGSSEELEERIKALWQNFDVDGNNILDLQEQEQFFGVVYDFIFKRKGSLKLRKESREETIMQWRKHFDANNDGQLSWTEFKESMKLIQDADEAEKILDKALNAPDQVVDDTLIGSKKFLYSDSMLSLGVKTVRKGSQLGKIPKLELISELWRIFETSFSEAQSKLTEQQKHDMKKEIGDRIDDYDSLFMEAISEDAKTNATSAGKGDEKPEKSRRGLTRRLTVTKKAIKLRAQEIGSTITQNPMRHIADLLLIYLKTLHPLIESLGMDTRSLRSSAKELRVDLYAISSQIGAVLANSEFLKTVPKSETLLSVHQSVTSILESGLEGKQIEFNTEKLDIGSYVLHTKKKFLDNAARNVTTLLSTSTALLSSLVFGAPTDMDRFGLLILTRGFLNLLKSINNDIESAIVLVELKPDPPKSKNESLLPSIWDPNPEVTDPDIDPNDGFRPGSFNQILARLTTMPLTVGSVDSLLFGGFNFGSPEFIVAKFIERFNVPPEVYRKDQGASDKMKEQTAQLLGCFLRKDLHALDAKDFDTLEKFCQTIHGENSEVSSDISEIVKSSSTRFAVKNFKIPSRIPMFTLPMDAAVPFNFFSFMSFEDEEVAEQISRLDWAFYKLIEPNEFEDQSWNKRKNEVYGKNLTAFMNRVNAISHWAATALILPEKLAMRQEVLKKLVGIAKALRDHNNFSSLVGVLTGLNMAASQRLKFTLETHGKITSVLKSLNQFQDPSKSFGILRNAMTEIEDECIPFIGIYLGDLVLMDDGNPDRVTLQNVELINLPKYRMMSQTVSNVLHYKFTVAEGSHYEVEPIEPLTAYFSNPPYLIEDELYKLSLEREPRGAVAKDIV